MCLCVRIRQAGMILAQCVSTMGAGMKIKVCNSRLEEINHVLMTVSMLGKAQSVRRKLTKVVLAFNGKGGLQGVCVCVRGQTKASEIVSVRVFSPESGKRNMTTLRGVPSRSCSHAGDNTCNLHIDLPLAILLKSPC